VGRFTGSCSFRRWALLLTVNGDADLKPFKTSLQQFRDRPTREELYVAGGHTEGPPVLTSVRGLQLLFVVFEEVGVDDEFSSLDEFLVDLLPVHGVLMVFTSTSIKI